MLIEEFARIGRAGNGRLCPAARHRTPRRRHALLDVFPVLLAILIAIAPMALAEAAPQADSKIPCIGYIIERVDLSDRSCSRQRMFIWDGPNPVDLPMDDAGKWYAIQPGSLDEALYSFIYENLRRRGKI